MTAKRSSRALLSLLLLTPMTWAQQPVNLAFPDRVNPFEAVPPTATYETSPSLPAAPAEAPTQRWGARSFMARHARQRYDYEKIFQMSREILTRKGAKKLLNDTLAEFLVIDDETRKRLHIAENEIREITETQLVTLLRDNPRFWSLIRAYLTTVAPDGESKKAKKKIGTVDWSAEFKAALSDPELLKNFRAINDPTEPLLLDHPDGSPGYRNAKVWVNHERKVNGETRPADNLKQVWIDFFKSAKKQGTGRQTAHRIAAEREPRRHDGKLHCREHHAQPTCQSSRRRVSASRKRISF